MDSVEPEIRRLLMATPRMPATVIAERIGWTRSLTVLKERVRELRPLFLPPDPSGRTEYLPGELAQWDLWFPPADVPLEAGQIARPPVIVGICGYSRMMVGQDDPLREAHDILSGNLACLLELGAVPRAGVYDNEGALVSRRGGKANLSDPFQRFRGTLGMKVIVLRPRDPEAKGVVERHNGYLETSFLPGRQLLLAGRLQRPAHRVARAGQPPHPCHAALPAGRALRRGPGGHDAAPAGAARHRLASQPAPRSRPLRPRRDLRLLRAPQGRRPPHRGRRHGDARSSSPALARSSPAMPARGPSTGR